MLLPLFNWLGTFSGGTRAFILVWVSLSLLVSIGARAQAPSWQTAIAVSERSSGINSSSVYATAAAANGDVYVAGSFNGTVNLGAFTLTSGSVPALYLAKWSPATGSFIWVEQGAHGGHAAITALAVNGPNVYLTGYFQGDSARFGNTLLSHSAPTSFTSDIFIAKLTDAGSTASFSWTRQAGSAGEDIARSIAVSGSSVYLTGFFKGPSTVFGSTVLTNRATFGGENVFVAKLTDAGLSADFTWAVQAGGTHSDGGRALAVQGSNVYLTGRLSSKPATFGSLTISCLNYAEDVFVAKLTDAGTSGSFTWVQQASGGFGPGLYVRSLALSGSSVYIAGVFDGLTANFGATTLTNASPTISNSDIFIAKLTDAGASGSFTWAERAGGVNSEAVVGLAADGPSLYLAGNISSQTSQFGPHTLGNFAGNNSSGDAFVAKMTDAGSSVSFNWAQSAGGFGRDEASTMALSGSIVYLGGWVETPAHFGNTAFTYPNNSYVPFLASITDQTVLSTTSSNLLAAPTVFPNPAHASATVVVPAFKGASPGRVTLVDALGRVVRDYALAPGPGGARCELSLQGLAPGLYRVVHMQAGSQRTTQLLAVE
ncbi:T9SS type A sorting domain-containing protein [Hymenobacter sp. B1770]|uniref:T9SS type A sorting domain-containing protein n=1 Tax=Hymenobacter sp. B1770 TaxID=1718788 RepID=UPI003CEE4605